MRSVVALSVAVSLIAAPVFAQTPTAVPEPEHAEADAPAPAPAPSASTGAAAKRGEDVISPLGAVWRSALVPGWGQRYKGETKKGWIFTGVAAGLLGASSLTYVNMRGFTLPTAKKAGGAQGAYDNETSTTADYDSLHQNAVNSTVVFDAVALATAGWWLYGASDSAFTPLEHLRIKDARVKDVFPAMIKYYQGKPVATISVENRSSEAVTKVKVKFEAKDIMDVPAESAIIEIIPPGLGKSIDVTAAFNNKVFDVGSEPKGVAAKITIEYEVGGKKRDITRTATFTVYNRNAIVWDDMRKMAAFVTPRDESVKSLVSLVARKDVVLPGKAGKPARTVRAPQFASAKALSQAAAYFDALSASGITYVSDPTAPFQYFDGNAEAVDYIAYPAETLRRKTGDCDDLTALYSAMLESSGIPTALVDVPGHVFLMFDSGLTPDEARLYNSNDAFYVRNGTAWVPVEVTAVGKSFREAWALAATQVKKWNGLDQLTPVDVLDAQSEFPSSPPTLTVVDASKLGLNDQTFAKLLIGDAVLAEKEEQGRQARIAEIRNRKTLSDPAKMNEIGIIYARDGMLKDAEKYFTHAMKADPRLFKAYNNLANVRYLLNDFEGAIEAYDQALAVGGDQAAVLINMASLYYEKGDKANAKKYFDRAARLEPVYEKEYPELAAVSRGDDAKIAARTGGPGASKAAGVGAGEKDPRRSRWIP